MQSYVHFSFFFLPDRPTDPPGDGKRNILWGWPKTEKKISAFKSILIHVDGAYDQYGYICL